MQKLLLRWWNRWTRRVVEQALRDYLTPERFQIPPEWEQDLQRQIRFLRPHHFPILESFAHRMAHRVLDDIFGERRDDTVTP